MKKEGGFHGSGGGFYVMLHCNSLMKKVQFCYTLKRETMKTTIYNFAILFFFVIAFESCGNHEQVKTETVLKQVSPDEIPKTQGMHQAKIDLSAEDQLVITNYFKDTSKLRTEALSFSNRIKCQNGKQLVPIDTEQFEIQMHHLVEWFLLKRTDPKIVSAVKIHFGLESNKIIPLFEWILLTNNGNTKHTVVYKINAEGKIYSYSLSNGFGQISRARYDTLMDNYKKNIRIRHFNRSGPNNFDSILVNGKDDWRNDSRGIILTFQEIFSLYERTVNSDNHEQDAARYCGTLYLHNGANIFDKKGLDFQKSRYKHTIFIVTSPTLFYKVGPTVKVFDAPAIGANLGHLSPPNNIQMNFDR
jgi:hypothetical protein